MTVLRESILLVDDEEAIRCILNRGLALRGFICDEAEQALAKLKVNPSDLVIMDINIEILTEILTHL